MGRTGCPVAVSCRTIGSNSVFTYQKKTKNERECECEFSRRIHFAKYNISEPVTEFITAVECLEKSVGLENPRHGDRSSRLIDDDCGGGFSKDVSYEIVHFLRETAMNRLVCEITNTE